jgi:tape measure domain-containing protein
MAVELASAWISLVPSTRNIGAQVSKEVTGPLEAAAAEAGVSGGRAFGSNLFSNMRSGLDRVGSTILSTVGGFLKRGGQATGIAAGATIAAGLWGGLQRSLDREDAIITFRRLGLDDQNIEQLVTGIDEALAGTAVTNPEGFALAGRFLAQGFDEADVPEIVGTIADMAAVGNRSFGEMADVLVSAAGQGRITAAELNRMGDIPLGKVATELGLAEDELREMVSSGELTADAFMEAFAAVDEFSGAARDPTTRTAFANLKTAVSALGEQFLGPLLGEGGVAQQAMLSLRDIVSAAGPFVTDLGRRFADWLIPAVATVADIFQNRLVPAFQVAFDWFNRHREIIGTVVRIVGPALLIFGGLAVAVALFGQAAAVVAAIIAAKVTIALFGLVAGLVAAWQHSETFREVVTGVFNAVAGVVRAAVDRVRSLIQTGTAVALAIWERFGGQIVRFITTSLSNVQRVIGGVFNVIRGIWEVVTGLLTGDWQKFGEGIGRIAGGFMNILRGLFSQAWNVIQTLWSTAGTAIASAIRDRFNAIIDWFRGIPQRIRTAFGNPGELLRGIGRQIIEGLIGGITSKVGDAIQSVKDAATGIVDGAKSALGIGSPSKVFADIGADTLLGMIRGIESQRRDLLHTMTGTIESAIVRPAQVTPTINAAATTQPGAAAMFSEGLVQITTENPQETALETRYQLRRLALEMGG